MVGLGSLLGSVSIVETTLYGTLKFWWVVCANLQVLVFALAAIKHIRVAFYYFR